MSNQPSEKCREDLGRLLRTGVHCAIGLKEILNDERTALELQDTDALNETAVNKQLFLSRLEELEAERREICQASGFSAEPEAMEKLVEWCDTELLIHGYWDHFVDLAKECSDLNINNGAIINLRRQQIIGALSVIRGERQDSETYSRNGRDTSTSVKRVLAEI